MSIDPSKDRFDQMLTMALQRHYEPVPADFTEKMLKKIRQANEQKILARVILQEKLTLAACFIFGSFAVLAAIVLPYTLAEAFSNLSKSMIQQIEVLIGIIPQAINNFSSQWHLYTIIGGALAIAACSLLELFIGDRFANSSIQ